MATIADLTAAVQTKALAYLNDTDETITSFPSSIAEFVIEFAIRESHIPNHYSESDIATLFANYVSTLAMMCVDVYSKAGAEGEISHSEGNTSRQYESAFISKSLINMLPNFVNTPSTI